MTTLLHRRYTQRSLRELVNDAPHEPATLTDDHRRSLTARFRAVASSEHRRLDAWLVERAGQPSGSFTWNPVTARRLVGNAAVRRVVAQPDRSLRAAVGDEIDEQLLRVASGYARGGSLAYWLAGLSEPVRGLVVAEALNWASSTLEAARHLDVAWSVASSDAYYDVAAARTTLRARRDLIIGSPDARVVVRLRSGAPGKSAGPGLRADLTIETLADHDGRAPSRIIGLWPDAGVCLAVDGTMDDLRAGARDLVRTAVAQRRQRLVLAA